MASALLERIFTTFNHHPHVVTLCGLAKENAKSPERLTATFRLLALVMPNANSDSLLAVGKLVRLSRL